MHRQLLLIALPIVFQSTQAVAEDIDLRALLEREIRPTAFAGLEPPTDSAPVVILSPEKIWFAASLEPDQRIDLVSTTWRTEERERIPTIRSLAAHLRVYGAPEDSAPSLRYDDAGDIFVIADPRIAVRELFIAHETIDRVGFRPIPLRWNRSDVGVEAPTPPVTAGCLRSEGILGPGGLIVRVRESVHRGRADTSVEAGDQRFQSSDAAGNSVAGLTDDESTTRSPIEQARLEWTTVAGEDGQCPSVPIVEGLTPRFEDLALLLQDTGICTPELFVNEPVDVGSLELAFTFFRQAGRPIGLRNVVRNVRRGGNHCRGAIDAETISLTSRTEKYEQLSRTDILQEIAAAELNQCKIRYSLPEPNGVIRKTKADKEPRRTLGVRYRLSFRVGTDGRAADVKILDEGVASSAFGQCVVKKVREITWPPNKGAPPRIDIHTTVDTGIPVPDRKRREVDDSMLGIFFPSLSGKCAPCF